MLTNGFGDKRGKSLGGQRCRRPGLKVRQATSRKINGKARRNINKTRQKPMELRNRSAETVNEDQEREWFRISRKLGSLCMRSIERPDGWVGEPSDLVCAIQ